MVSGACEVAALDLETLPRSEAGKVDAEFRLNVSTHSAISKLSQYWGHFALGCILQYGVRILGIPHLL